MTDGNRRAEKSDRQIRCGEHNTVPFEAEHENRRRHNRTSGQHHEQARVHQRPDTERHEQAGITARLFYAQMQKSSYRAKNGYFGRSIFALTNTFRTFFRGNYGMCLYGSEMPLFCVFGRGGINTPENA